MVRTTLAFRWGGSLRGCSTNAVTLVAPGRWANRVSSVVLLGTNSGTRRSTPAVLAPMTSVGQG